MGDRMITIGLDRPKTPANIGMISRLGGNFQVNLIGYTDSDYNWHKADTQKAIQHIPHIQTDDLLKIRPYGSKIVGLEILPGSIDLRSFHHPKNAFYLFGPENGSLDPRYIEACDFIVKIPSYFCMNLAMCCAVVLYDRLLKEGPENG